MPAWRRAIAARLESGKSTRGAALAEPLIARLSAQRLERALARPSRDGVVGVFGSTLGGSWKTPVSLALAAELAAEGVRVAFVSHGYGGHLRRARVVSAGDAASQIGDEATLAVRRFAASGVRVYAGPDAVAIARAAELDALLVVDGTATPGARPAAWKLLVLDAGVPWGAGRCFPIGDLRAPHRSLLSAADAVALVYDKRADAAPFTEEPFLLASRHRNVFAVAFDLDLSPTVMAGAPVAVITAIARPARFLAALRRRGIQVVWETALDDHAGTTAAVAAARSLTMARARGVPFARVVTTEKCAVWLPSQIDGVRVEAARLRITLPEALCADARARWGRSAIDKRQ